MVEFNNVGFLIKDRNQKTIAMGHRKMGALYVR